MEEKINNISSLILKDCNKEIVKEIINLLKDKDLSISKIYKILDDVKKVLPIIATLRD